MFVCNIKPICVVYQRVPITDTITAVAVYIQMECFDRNPFSVTNYPLV